MGEILITALSWGQMEVTINGEKQHYRDCKIWPAGAREWRWEETGTHHSPGIQPADIEEILEHEPEAVVLGRGQLGRLNMCAETEALLHKRGISYHIEKTGKAIALFNDLINQGKRVGGLFHSTC
jgi:hypothetical protein